MTSASSGSINDGVETEVTGRYWRALGDDRVVCELCPRLCKLRNGQRGFCFVRQNSGGKVVLTTYGRSSGFCIDPIEKKPLNHFYPGSAVLSFGTAGCNLACKFCQNWSISKSRETDTLADVATPGAIAEAAAKAGCRSVAFTYNDPVIFHEYAIDTAVACREKGIKSIAVTAGYICEEPRKEFFAHMDAANIDLKAFTEDFYHKLTGAHLQPVLDTLEYVHKETDCWLEVTTLLIPGHNDSDAELHQLAEWYLERLGPDVPLHLFVHAIRHLLAPRRAEHGDDAEIRWIPREERYREILPQIRAVIEPSWRPPGRRPRTRRASMWSPTSSVRSSTARAALGSTPRPARTACCCRGGREGSCASARSHPRLRRKG